MGTDPVTGIEQENEDDIMYLPPLVIREVEAGYAVDIVGSMTASNVSTMETVQLYRKQMRGRFGIVKWREENPKKVGIMTKIMPSWAADVFERHILESPIAAKHAGLQQNG